MSKKAPITILPPVSPELSEASSQDAQMGIQITEQYERATGAMREVVIFGAMMMLLREKHPDSVGAGRPKKLSARGQLSDDQPFTLQKWLETYAPKVKRGTALRFLAVTESIATEYKEIVGAKTAKLISLTELVTTPADQLAPDLSAKQLDLFGFVSGTSQRSWLDRFMPNKAKKKRTLADQGEDTIKTPEELAEEAYEELTGILNLLDGWFIAGHHARIPKDKRAIADSVLEDARKKIQDVK